MSTQKRQAPIAARKHPKKPSSVVVSTLTPVTSSVFHTSLSGNSPLLERHVRAAMCYLRITRDNVKDRRVIEHLLHLFDRKSNYRTSFCAAGVGYSAVEGYSNITRAAYDPSDPHPLIRANYRPTDTNLCPLSASCSAMWEHARKVQNKLGPYRIIRPHELADLTEVQRGWIVVYHLYDSHPGANHVGIVLGAKAGAPGVIETLEFNTGKWSNGDGGQVLIRDRKAWLSKKQNRIGVNGGLILGFIGPI